MLPCAGISMCRNQPKPQNTMSRNISWNINYIWRSPVHCAVGVLLVDHLHLHFFSPPVARPRRILGFPPLTSRSWKNCWAKRRRTKKPPSNCHVPFVNTCCVFWTAQGCWTQGPHGACLFFCWMSSFLKNRWNFYPHATRHLPFARGDAESVLFLTRGLSFGMMNIPETDPCKKGWSSA